ncbi:hypothetical protein ABPG74_010213 [Tetrahymena malaccensis]
MSRYGFRTKNFLSSNQFLIDFFSFILNLAELTSNSFISLQQDNLLVQLASNSNPNSNTTSSNNTTTNTNTTVSTNTTIITNSTTNSTNPLNSQSSNLGIGNYNCQSDLSIQTMHFIYLSTNPYCQGLNCISGQAIIDATIVGGGRFRNLQSNPGVTYQLTYNVNPKQIQQTICVSYDSNGLMTINPTNINTSTNQITCTFTNNSSLYYDFTCQYVSSSLCSSSSSPNPPSPSGDSSNSTSGFQATIYKTSLKVLRFSLILAFIICLMI